MNGFVDAIAQLGTMVLSLSLGLLIVWGSLVGLFRAFFSPEQAGRVNVLQYEPHGLESNRAPRRA